MIPERDQTLRDDLPVIVITRDHYKHVEALAYANGARSYHFVIAVWRAKEAEFIA